MLDVSVIVPTYQEAENLPPLVARIAAALTAAGRSFEIVVVDDDSRDGTEEVCAELARSQPLRCLVRRRERGLASAVLHGVAHSEGTFVAVLDADLSHPPERLPDLVAAVEAGADFALGSRYVAGGDTEEGWGLLRVLNSRIATLLARPLVAVSDPMAGFFVLRRQSIADAPPLDPLGFKIALELMVKCRCREIRELPIHFAKRVHGASKLGLREQWQYLLHLLRLYRFRLADRGRSDREGGRPDRGA